MHEFIGRQRELQVLEEAWEDTGSGLLPIYGRRRVGKSELILRFLGDKPAIYYVGKKAPGQLQIREFLEVAANALDEPLLAGYGASDWGDALDVVMGRRSDGGKIALVFDEFQWMVEASPELPSLLQERWDRTWQRSGDVLLILCGSYIGFMEREVLGRRSPLFGRRTAQILLRPFDYREAAGFHPNYSLVDRARTYFVCGGVPFYLRLFSDRRSFEMNLTRVVLDEHAALYREPDFLLREELREVENYYAVLLAIAGGQTTAREIARVSGIDSSSLPYYLKQLMELGYVARRYPLTGEPRNPRSVRYDLGDPLLRFWFHFVFPEQSQLRRLGPSGPSESGFDHVLMPTSGTVSSVFVARRYPGFMSGKGSRRRLRSVSSGLRIVRSTSWGCVRMAGRILGSASGDGSDRRPRWSVTWKSGPSGIRIVAMLLWDGGSSRCMIGRAGRIALGIFSGIVFRISINRCSQDLWPRNSRRRYEQSAGQRSSALFGYWVSSWLLRPGRAYFLSQAAEIVQAGKTKYDWCPGSQ